MDDVLQGGRCLVLGSISKQNINPFHEDILACQSKKATGVTNNVNDGSVLKSVSRVSE